jgi:hypothetical protein
MHVTKLVEPAELAMLIARLMGDRSRSIGE